MPTGVFAGLYCTDADIAEVAIGDFAVLTARAERAAYGKDGTIAAGSFVLTSAFPFATQGVGPGHVAVLIGSSVTPPGPTGGPAVRNDVLPVVSAVDGALTLGRLGYPPGLGAFPGLPAPGGSTSVEFAVPTLLAQIKTATGEVRRILTLRVDTQLLSPTDVRLATVYMVLAALYRAQSRQDGDENAVKAASFRASADDEMESLRLTYGDQAKPGRRAVIATMTDGPPPIDPSQPALPGGTPIGPEPWRVPRNY